MSSPLRILNEHGLRAFSEYLTDLRRGSRANPPWEILEDAWYTAKLPGKAMVDERRFENRLDAAKYLYGILRPLGHAKVERNVGLWSWLSLFYFDQVCPLEKTGIRKPGRDYRHILELDFRRHYRHLLASPFSIFRIHGEKAPLLLHGPVTKISKFHEQLASRQAFMTNKGVIQAANLLYFDKKAGRPKSRSATGNDNPGTLFRFINVVRQLELTYDLYSMSGKEVIDLLPPEFDKWRK